MGLMKAYKKIDEERRITGINRQLESQFGIY